MNTIYEETKKLLFHGMDAVIVSIVDTDGSSPGKIGSKMLVFPNGKIIGTIGGGDLEKYCIDSALNVYKTKKTYTKEFKLDSSEHGDVSMICGGNVTVEFRFVESTISDKELNSLFDLDTTNPRALIFGGGHVGKALCPILSGIGFDVYIFDDRPEFANKEIHPTAKDCIVCNFQDIGKSVNITKDDYVIIMSHGHVADRDLLLQACKTDATYIGCIGSKRKIEMTQQHLRDNGIPEERIRSVNSPIGLPIGGDTPAEIAISIAAKLIQHRYSK